MLHSCTFVDFSEQGNAALDSLKVGSDLIVLKTHTHTHTHTDITVVSVVQM